jgi:hypothetical protein
LRADTLRIPPTGEQLNPPPSNHQPPASCRPPSCSPAHPPASFRPPSCSPAHPPASCRPPSCSPAHPPNCPPALPSATSVLPPVLPLACPTVPPPCAIALDLKHAPTYSSALSAARRLFARSLACLSASHHYSRPRFGSNLLFCFYEPARCRSPPITARCSAMLRLPPGSSHARTSARPSYPARTAQPASLIDSLATSPFPSLASMETILHLPSPRHHPTCPFPSYSIPLALSPFPQTHSLHQLIPSLPLPVQGVSPSHHLQGSPSFFPRDSGCDPGYTHFFSIFFSFYFCQHFLKRGTRLSCDVAPTSLRSSLPPQHRCTQRTLSKQSKADATLVAVQTHACACQTQPLLANRP